MHANKKEHVSFARVVIAFFQSVIYFILLLLICFLSSLLHLTDNESQEETFNSQFEKYIVLASGVFLIAPFTLSNVLILGIFHKNVRIIYIWVKINLGTNSVLVGCMLAAGIYIIVEGTLYVGCSLVGVSLILAGFAGYFTYMGLKIIEEIRTMENSERDETVNSSSSDTSTESA